MNLALFSIGILMPFGILANSVHVYNKSEKFCFQTDQHRNDAEQKEASCSRPPVGSVNSSAVLKLHTEIQQFYEYIQLTPIERALRERVIARIESLVLQLWPNAKIKVIGSFSYGLTLPTSDIDIMILGVPHKSALRLLATKIHDNDIAERNSIEVKDYLRVPIIEFVDRESKLNIDMPLHNEPTLRVAGLLNRYQREYPVFVKIIIVLKQFLGQRHLNDVFTGGISSYALCLMCINFLEMHPETKANDDVNLGALLLDFLELYGQNFDFDTYGINIGHGGKTFPRTEMPCGLVDGQYRLFCIIDATNPWLNACSVTYRAPDIKQAFNEAFTTLSLAIQNATNEQSNSSSSNILNQIVSPSDHFLEYRNWIRDNFDENGKRLN